MWLKVLIHCFLWLHVIMVVYCHLPPYVETEVNRVEAACDQARKCIHDTIPICGKSSSGSEKIRTFWDLCDLFEYSCDNEEVWRHTPDVEGCPNMT
ncbi:uncharacterized protein LOC134746933 [Cydia strobilella]|uniref:uncharacterized protein LOC134746933 n=1 Tax=Cydia strobilella TaxID=1100964 RepID=UPI003007269E